jgi:hypothetical protein
MFTHCYANQSFSQQNHPFIATETRSKIRCSQASIWDMVRIPGYHDGSSGDSQPFDPRDPHLGVKIHNVPFHDGSRVTWEMMGSKNGGHV